MKENLRFKQLRLNYISNQKTNEKRKPKISNKLYYGSCDFKCTRTVDYRLRSVFLKEFKHLSHSILVLLF